MIPQASGHYWDIRAVSVVGFNVVGEPDSEQNQLNKAAHVVLAVVSVPK